MACLAYPSLALEGLGDYWTFSCFCYSLLVLGTNSRAAFLTRTWNKYSVLLFVCSLLSYSLWLLCYEVVARTVTPGMWHVAPRILTNGTFWACIVFQPVVQLCADTLVWYSCERRWQSLLTKGEARFIEEDEHNQTAEKAEIESSMRRNSSCQLYLNLNYAWKLTSVSCVMLFIGGWNLRQRAQRVTTFGFQYESSDYNWQWFPTALDYAANVSHPCQRGSVCDISITVPTHFVGSSVWVYYYIGPFFSKSCSVSRKPLY